MFSMCINFVYFKVLCINLMYNIQINSTTKLGEITCFIDKLSQHVRDCGCQGFESRLVQHLLSLCVVLQAEGLDAGQVLDTVYDMVKDKQRVSSKGPFPLNNYDLRLRSRCRKCGFKRSQSQESDWYPFLQL